MKKKIYSYSKISNKSSELNSGLLGTGSYFVYDKNLACEQAIKDNSNGYINEFELIGDKLKILDFTASSSSLLSLIALTLFNNSVDAKDSNFNNYREYIINNYYPSLEGIDIIVAPLIDNFFYQVITDFVNNKTTYEVIKEIYNEIIKNKQIILYSNSVLQLPRYIHSYEVTVNPYLGIRNNKDIKGLLNYQYLSSKNTAGLFIKDIILKGDEVK